MVRYLTFGLWLIGLPAWGQEGLLPIGLNGQPVTKGGFAIRPRSQFFPDSSSDPNRSLAWARRQQFHQFALTNSLKSKSAGKHGLFGMQVTADRIRMINQLYNIQTQARIYDLVDSFGKACGTRVILAIPV